MSADLFILVIVLISSLLIFVVIYRMLIKFSGVTQQITNLEERFGQQLTHEVFKGQTGLKDHLHDLENKLRSLQLDTHDKFQNKMQESVRQTLTTFQEVNTRLQKVDQSQIHLNQLAQSISSIKEVLSDKKQRGIFGEIQLYAILKAVYGEPSPYCYQLQYSLSNQTKVDAALFFPSKEGLIPIDSKFPLENYRRSIDETKPLADRQDALKMLKQDFKKHINDISDKYILPGETSGFAILFLPAESLYLELYTNHLEIVEYAYQRKVWPSSPTTLMAMINSLKVIHNQYEQSKHAKEMQQELIKLSDEFERFQDRFEKFFKQVEQISQSGRDLSITSEKIVRRFSQISQVKWD
ncbi:MAG: DNA recombination protein RmuC [Bacteriovoracaceae bacterium]|nr:DNA recombination protein RmuC [Bacteriovoracaceae bacterium]